MAHARKSFYLILASLFLGFSYLQADDVRSAVVGPFGTLNNYDNPLIIGSEKAQDLLNVDITPGGKSVKKRKGYGSAFTLPIATAAVHGTYKFYDLNSSEVVLAFNDTRVNASVNGGQFSTIYSTGPNNATWQCVDSQGFAYCNNSSRSSLIRFTGSGGSSIALVNSTGTMVAVTPDRLVISGFAEAPNRIDFSQSANFTSFLPPFSAGTDSNQITITAPGSRVTHIVYAFGRLIWFKDTSMGYILFAPLLGDWQVRTISSNIGTNDNSSIYWEDILYFRGQDGHFYAYDGSNVTQMSRDITPTINLAQSRISASWVQTNQSDFDAGVSTPTGFVTSTVTVGSLSLGTATAISPFIDTDPSDFIQGDLATNVSTSTTVGSVTLALNPEIVLSSSNLSNTNGRCDSCSTSSMAFFSTTTNAIGSAVLLRLIKFGSPGDYTINIANDNSGSPGTVISSASLASSLVSNSTSNVYLQIRTTKLSPGTTFWIQLVPNVSCNASNYIGWVGFSFAGSPNPYILCAGVATGGFSPGRAVFGKTFVLNGSYASRAFDTGFSTNTWVWDWDTINASYTTPSGTEALFKTQTSTSASGGFNAFISVSPGGRPKSDIREFFRYQTDFTTTDISTSPSLERTSISMSSRLRPGGTFYSQVNNAPNLTSWDSFSAIIVNSTNAHSFSIRSSTNSFTVLSSTPNWTSISNGSIPNISSGTYFQVRDIIVTTTTAFGNPRLDSFTQSWFEGQAADKAYGGYFDKGLWWNVQLGTTSTSNNYVLKYDLLNQGFTLYTMPMNGFYVKNNELYFASSSSGTIFKFGDVDNDNGSTINGYWKSKDFILGDSPFNEDELVRISVLSNTVNNSSMTVTYTIDGSSSTSFVMPLNYGLSSYRHKNINIPLGTVGTTLNIQFGNNAADQSFETYAIEYGIRERPWRPQP